MDDIPGFFKVWFLFCAVLGVASTIFVIWAVVTLLGILSEAVS